MSDVWLGSKLIVKDEELKLIINNLHAKTLQNIRDTDSYIDIHNAFTAYTVMLLFCATGHRPVEDPFCYKKDYDLDLSMMLIDDKAVSERHRYRIVALPEIAIKQMREYENHIKWLVSHLMKEKISPELKHAIYQTLNSELPRKRQSLPMFFFIKRQKKCFKTYSINESRLTDYLKETWPLPYNFSRHNIATQLRIIRTVNREYNLSVENIESHLGHMNGINHPFGTSSVISPVHYQKTISIPLNNLLIDQGWKLIKAKRHHKNLNKMKEMIWRHGSPLLGPRARQETREIKKKTDIEIMEKALNIFPIKDIINDPSLIDKVRSSIIKKSSNDVERIKVRLILLWRKLLYVKKQNSHFVLPRRLHLVDIEPSPFKENTLSLYRKAEQIRQNFIAYLQSEGKLNSQNINRKTNYYKRVAEILVSAALFDGLSNEERLNNLSLSPLTLSQEGEIIYLDIMGFEDNHKKSENLLWRWLPQALSIALMTGIDSNQIISKPITIINLHKIQEELKKLLCTLGIGIEHKDTSIKNLVKYSKAFWIMHAPPFLRDIANGNLPVQPLPETGLVRLIRGQRLIRKEEGELVQEFDNSVSHYAMNVNSENHRLNNSTNFHIFLKEQIKEAGHLTGKNKKSASYVRKEHLERTIRSKLNKKHKYSSIAVAIGSWCIKLCSQGTDLYGKIAFSTVNGYTNMIAAPLLEIAYKRNFFHLSPEEYDDMYEIAFEINSHSDQTKLLNNLKDFHNFLVHAGLAPALDWSGFNQQVIDNRTISSVDANIITPTEYERALNILYDMREEEKYNKRTMMQYCALLICGYRFGLRISEAFHLQYRHIQHNNDWSLIVINVVNTFIDDKKSKAGNRYSPLVGKLTDFEKSVLEVVFKLHVPIKNDELAVIFSDEDNSRELFNTFKASQTLQEILKHVTGDPFAHFHILRHSYDSRIYPQLFDITKGTFSRYIQLLSGDYFSPANELRKFLTGIENQNSLGLKALSVTTGHSQVKTTFSNYIHTADHHIHHLMGKTQYWDTLSVNRVDFITSYAHGKKWESLKKQRQRMNVKPNNLLSALTSSNANIKLQKSKINTMPHPIIEKDIELMNAEVTRTKMNKKISLNDIDNILLLTCIQEEVEAGHIAERLNMSIDDTARILTAFNKQKQKTKYLGYRQSNQSMHISKNNIDIETSSETVSLQPLLKSLSEKILAFSDKNKLVVSKGINTWAENYYPNKRYRPLILDEPDTAIEYLEAMRLLGIRSNHMMATIPKVSTPWCKLRKREIKGKEVLYSATIKSTITKRTYLIHRANISSHIPLSTTKLRYISKQRVSFSLDKLSLHPLHVQKRLHRVCFLLSIWMDL